MISRQQSLSTATDTTADLDAQFRELLRLRAQVRKAQASARKPEGRQFLAARPRHVAEPEIANRAARHEARRQSERNHFPEPMKPARNQDRLTDVPVVKQGASK
jgi:hypothetical protein